MISAIDNDRVQDGGGGVKGPGSQLNEVQRFYVVSERAGRLNLPRTIQGCGFGGGTGRLAGIRVALGRGEVTMARRHGEGAVFVR